MFLISLQGKDSIYEQIRNQILRFIKSGVLNPHDKLPSVRQLAQDLGINPNTVQKAYQELEKDGYIYTLSKKGAFVADRSQKKDMDSLAYEFMETVRRFNDLGIDKETLKSWIDNMKEDSDNAGD